LPRANGVRTPPTIARGARFSDQHKSFLARVPGSAGQASDYDPTRRHIIDDGPLFSFDLLVLSTSALWAAARLRRLRPKRPIPGRASNGWGLWSNDIGTRARRSSRGTHGAPPTSPSARPRGNIAPQTLADSLALERRYLEELAAVPRSTLDAGSQLTYDLFRRGRLLAVEGFTYPYELLPVNPYEGMPQQFALMAPAAERLALSSAKEFDDWRTRTSASSAG